MLPISKNLWLTRLHLGCRRGNHGNCEVKQPVKLIDSGAGFLIEEDPNEEPEPVKITHQPGTVRFNQ